MPNDLYKTLIQALHDRLGDRAGTYALPPPVFVTVQGEFVRLDLDAGLLTARFPVLDGYLNPYHSMQGIMIAAAVDNTLGPLSMLVAPPNVTLRLEMTYSRPAPAEIGYILVEAKRVEREGRWLRFQATVRDPEEQRLARCKATHWIID